MVLWLSGVIPFPSKLTPLVSLFRDGSALQWRVLRFCAFVRCLLSGGVEPYTGRRLREVAANVLLVFVATVTAACTSMRQVELPPE